VKETEKGSIFQRWKLQSACRTDRLAKNYPAASSSHISYVSSQVHNRTNRSKWGPPPPPKTETKNKSCTVHAEAFSAQFMKPYFLIFGSTEYTQSGNATFWRHFKMKVKSAQPGEGGGGVARPPPYTLSTIASEVVVYAPAERADTLPPFLLYSSVYSVF
jgi:hypothetical protein